MNPTQIQTFIDHFASEIQKGIIQIAPQAFHVLVAVKQADSIGNLITSGIGFFVFLILAVALAFVSYHGGHIANNVNPYDEGQQFASVTVSLLAGAGAVIAAVIADSTSFVFLNQWNWIGAFRPDIAVYHDIIVKVLSTK